MDKNSIVILAANAAAMRLTSDGLPALAKRSSHGISLGAWLGRIAKGPSGSSNQPGTFQNNPGTDAGITSVTAIPPALPNDALSPSGSRSTTVTLTPSFSR